MPLLQHRGPGPTPSQWSFTTGRLRLLLPALHRHDGLFCQAGRTATASKTASNSGGRTASWSRRKTASCASCPCPSSTSAEQLAPLTCYADLEVYHVRQGQDVGVEVAVVELSEGLPPMTLAVFTASRWSLRSPPFPPASCRSSAAQTGHLPRRRPCPVVARCRCQEALGEAGHAPRALVLRAAAGGGVAPRVISRLLTSAWKLWIRL